MTPQGKVIAVFVVSGCALGTGVVLYEKANGTVADTPIAGAPIATEAGPEDLVADWCAPGFEPIRGNACLASGPGKPSAPLVVYLHGRYARDAASEEIDRQRRLAARATALGFAVIALRGRLGACTAPELAQWYCWPSNETNADAGAEFVDAWTPALAAAQERTGSRRRFLLGFSNGGYFAGLIASRGLLAFDALVVAHGGPVEPVHAFRGTPPLLLLSADDDVAQDEMIRFDEELTREHWPHDSYARAGGHGLTDEDITAALTFFSRAREALPLQPPLALHRAVRHVREAGAEGQIQADETDAGTRSAPEEPEQELGEASRPAGIEAPVERVEREASVTTSIGASPSGAADPDP
jgi:predicted esterase